MKIELKQVLCPQPKSKIKASDGKSEGKYKFFTSSPMQTRFIDEANYDKPSLIFGTGGNASVHFCDEPFSTSTDCLVMYGRNKIELESIYNYLKGNISLLEHGFKGAGLKHISKDYILAIEIELPSEAMQHEFLQKNRIVDEIIEAKRTQLLLSEDLVKSRFIELFGDPVSNPHGYEKVNLSELADIKIGPFGSLLHKEDYIEGGHPLLNPSHIIDGKIAPDNKFSISNKKYDELSAYQLHIGDVVMGRRGEMGRCAVIPDEGYLCGTGSLLIRTKGEVTADYIQKVISFPSFRKTIDDMAVGQTMPNLNVPIVSTFQIIKPPIMVQKRFYAFVEQVDKSKFYIVQMQILLRLLIRAIQQKTTEVLL